jgi:hypothetical protein
MITLTREEAQKLLDGFERVGWARTEHADILRAKVRRDEIWASRDLSKCECDHNEYCQHCWPVELRENKT